MTTSERAGARIPRDREARERLREAQQAEARAVAEVYRAEAGLTRAEAKYEDTLAVAGAAVEQAKADRDRMRSKLVGISGCDRAAQLLGLTPEVLGKPTRGEPKGSRRG